MNVKMFFMADYVNIIQLPVNPSNLKIVSPGGNKTQETINLGEINILKNKRLQSITIDSVFPTDSSQPWVSASGLLFFQPTYLISYFQSLRKKQKPARFVALGPGINMLVSVENFEYEYVSGLENEVHYILELKEYKRFGLTKIAVDENGKKTLEGWLDQTRDTLEKKVDTIKMGVGGTLYKTAATVLGAGSKYVDIQKANKLLIGNDPTNVSAGEIIKIP